MNSQEDSWWIIGTFKNKKIKIVEIFWPHRGLYQSEEVACKYDAAVTECIRAAEWRLGGSRGEQFPVPLWFWLRQVSLHVEEDA